MHSYLYSLVSYALLLVCVIFIIAVTTLVERKVLGFIQRRKGPNVVGFFGLLQPFADGIKMILKEHIYMRDSDFYIFVLAPIFTFFCSLKLWLSIPFDELDYSIYAVNGFIYVLIIMSFSAYGIIFAGWSSNSKYAFLGGLRSTAQMISYEVCLSFIVLTVFVLVQSLDLRDVHIMQQDISFVYPLFPVWCLFIICALAETNRAPFDLPEAEAELVAGYNVEYSSIPFVLFFLAEYSNLVFMSCLSTLLFYSGFTGLEIVSLFIELPTVTFFDVLFENVGFSLGVTFHVLLFIQVRGALPRYRYDQLMKLGWKFMLPMSIIFLLLVIFMHSHLEKYVSLYY